MFSVEAVSGSFFPEHRVGRSRRGCHFLDSESSSVTVCKFVCFLIGFEFKLAFLRACIPIGTALFLGPDRFSSVKCPYIIKT